MMKKPLPRWTVQNATVITPIIPAAANGSAARGEQQPGADLGRRRQPRLQRPATSSRSSRTTPRCPRDVRRRTSCCSRGGETNPERTQDEQSNVELIIHRGNGRALVDRDDESATDARDGVSPRRRMIQGWSACAPGVQCSRSRRGMFATCTVLSSVALRWVIDHIFLPRFDEGDVAVTVAAGSVRLRRRCRPRRWRRDPRVFAGITQFRVGATCRATSSSASSSNRSRGISAARTATSSGGLGVDTDTAIAVLAPIPFATGRC